MIVSFKKAILHILDANSGITVYSQAPLDMSDAMVSSYISAHIEKVYADPGLRNGEFNDNSGFKYQMKQYLDGDTEFEKFSQFTAQRLYENIKNSENIESSDILVCECNINEVPIMAVLKFDNKIGYIHQTVQKDGTIMNDIINHYAILPPVTQKVSQCAFVNLNDLSIKYKGKKIVVEGESLDLIAEGLLECVFDISSKESFNAVQRIAKNVSKEYGGNGVEAEVKIKKIIKEAENVDIIKVAGSVFEGSVSAREEFIEKIQKADVPEKFEVNEYVAKKASKNIKMVTDTGIEISFPGEYYKDDENISIINNPDGKISIQINNIGEIMSK